MAYINEKQEVVQASQAATIQALVVNPENEVPEWVKGANVFVDGEAPDVHIIEAGKETLIASNDDYLVFSSEGVYSVMKAEDFAAQFKVLE